MTEAEWWAENDPCVLLDFVQDRASERKLQLFAVACCRRIWGLLTDARSREAVEAAERVADGSGDFAELAEAVRRAMEVSQPGGRDGGPTPADVALMVASRSGFDAAYACVNVAALAGRPRQPAPPAHGPASEPEAAYQANLLRDIVGNPFEPVSIPPRWTTPNVVELARTLYDDRAFDRLPILADALLDAGCTHEAILAHCRGPGPHTRGCWLVDLLLDKE